MMQRSEARITNLTTFLIKNPATFLLVLPSGIHWLSRLFLIIPEGFTNCSSYQETSAKDYISKLLTQVTQSWYNVLINIWVIWPRPDYWRPELRPPVVMYNTGHSPPMADRLNTSHMWDWKMCYFWIVLWLWESSDPLPRACHPSFFNFGQLARPTQQPNVVRATLLSSVTEPVSLFNGIPDDEVSAFSYSSLLILLIVTVSRDKDNWKIIVCYQCWALLLLERLDPASSCDNEKCDLNN
jgi:hypothetical protein